ncbi:eukaryotic membrane protein family protein [Cryptosporidium serpentis]
MQGNSSDISNNLSIKSNETMNLPTNYTTESTNSSDSVSICSEIEYLSEINTKDKNITSTIKFIWSEIRNNSTEEDIDQNIEHSNDDLNYKEFESVDDFFTNKDLNRKLIHDDTDFSGGMKIPKNTLEEVIQVPKGIENAIQLSFFVCLDSILYDLTFLSINAFISILKILLILIIILYRYIFGIFKMRSFSFDENLLSKCTLKQRTHTWEFSTPRHRESCSVIDEQNNDLDNCNVSNNINFSLPRNNSTSNNLNNCVLTNRELSSQKFLYGSLNYTKKPEIPKLNIGLFGYIKSIFFKNTNSLNNELSLDNSLSCISISNPSCINDWSISYPYLTLSPTEITDMGRFLVLIVDILLFGMIDISYFYHYIRGQSLMKLYVIFNMLEILEKLWRSLGRDLIDSYLESIIIIFSRYRLISLPIKETKEVVSPFLLYISVLTYVFIHCSIHMIRGLALNISINSSEYTMFLIVITNNFSEIKSTVFKTYNSVSLFSIVAADAIERFQLCCDACIVFIRMYSATRLQASLLSASVTGWLIIVYIVEVFIDWIKHSFLVKFNKIKASCYNGYVETIVGDLLLVRGSKTALNFMKNSKQNSNVNNSSIPNFKYKDDKELQNLHSNLDNIKMDNNVLFSNFNNANKSVSHQGSLGIFKSNTIGLDVDVSLTQKNDKKDEITFIANDLRNIYSFPYIPARRIGFMSLPMTVLFICVIPFKRLYSSVGIGFIFTFWLFLILIKCLSSLTLVSFARSRIERLQNWNTDFHKISGL